MRTLSALAIAVVVIVAAALSGIGLPEEARSAPAGPNGITVTGTGIVTSIPDRVRFSFGVSTEGTTASAALSANADRARALVAALRAAGVGQDAIQTQEVSVYPRTSDDGREIVGYTASNTVSARIDGIAKAGAVVDAAVRAGANHVSGPMLEVSERDALYRDALGKAYDDARAKAEALARAVDVSLGDVTRVVEVAAAGPGPVMLEAARAADTAGSTPIEPGKQELQATVTVTFAIDG